MVPELIIKLLDIRLSHHMHRANCKIRISYLVVKQALVIMFPDNFLWGVATSAYQIEGAAEEDGRGESIWDRFCTIPGAIADGSSGKVACDHYHRYKDDVKLMRDLGIQAYRMSIAWPRILPAGRGSVNKRGLDFYRSLFECLLENGIKPFPTLYHWDLPQALQQKGGWSNRDIAGWFSEYAAICADKFGDVIKDWATINEPWVIAHIGHGTGEMAPGGKSLKQALAVAHNLLVGHGLAVQSMRSQRSDLNLGIVNILFPAYAYTDGMPDQEAARLGWLKDSAWFLDPLFKKSYPEEAVLSYGELAPVVKDGDFEIIGQPLDFMGVNYYFRSVYDKGRLIRQVPGARETGMGWEIYPQGLKDLLCRIAGDYNLPLLYITENGAAYPDVPDDDGRIRDKERIAYLQEHLEALAAAIAEGAPVAGYFLWSLLDNFEWAHGLSKRFGIIYVDYGNLKRTAKTSAAWYSRVIAANGLPE